MFLLVISQDNFMSVEWLCARQMIKIPARMREHNKQ